MNQFTASILFVLISAPVAIAETQAWKASELDGPIQAEQWRVVDVTNCKATRQWFNTLTGELTKEEPCNFKGLGFWDDRPCRYEADAVMIIRNLKSLKN